MDNRSHGQSLNNIHVEKLITALLQKYYIANSNSTMTTNKFGFVFTCVMTHIQVIINNGNVIRHNIYYDVNIT